MTLFDAWVTPKQQQVPDGQVSVHYSMCCNGLRHESASRCQQHMIMHLHPSTHLLADRECVWQSDLVFNPLEGIRERAANNNQPSAI